MNLIAVAMMRRGDKLRSFTMLAASLAQIAGLHGISPSLATGRREARSARCCRLPLRTHRVDGRSAA